MVWKDLSKGNRLAIILPLLFVMLLLFFCLDLTYAPRPLSLKEIWDAFTGNGSWANNIIIFNFNIKRVIFGLFVGAGLAVTGCAMQAVFKNPLASPYILGLSSGASLGAAIAILISIPFIPLAIVQPILAFFFCFGTMILVYVVARADHGSRSETLILSGVAVSSLISALVSLMTYLAPSDKMKDIVFWSMGSLYGVDWENMIFAVPIIVLGVLLIWTQAKELNAMMLGDAHAMDLGVDVRRTRLFILLMSSLVVAAAVAFVGTIGFIGLVIPHIFRLLLGPDNKVLIPLSALGGATFIIMCDYISHMFSQITGVIPIGVVTALIGAPFFIYLLMRNRRAVGW